MKTAQNLDSRIRNEMKLLGVGNEVIATHGDKIYKHERVFLDKFLKDELVTIFEGHQKEHLQIKDKRGKLVSNISLKTDYLEVSPNLFGRGYGLYCNGHLVYNLNTEIWKRVRNYTPSLLH